MASPAFMRFLPRCGAAAAFGTLLGLAGCQSWLDDRYADSLPPTSGVQPIKGLAQNVSIRRNALGMPLIETGTFHDALFALGYVHASDRLSQMVSLRLLAQGRLAEMVGPGALEIDRFMRTVNLRQAAEIQYRNASPRLQRFFEVYARGVNAYLYRYRDKLPMDLAQSGYRPEYWKPEDSALVFALLNFGLAVNLQEEIASLTLAQKVGSDKLAWLTPTYPDENLPFDEAEKLKGLRLDGQVPGLAGVEGAARQVAALSMLGVAASNNWAIAPQRSRSGKSLMANDTHLPLSMPSVWNYVQIRSPKYQAAGVSIAGLPGVVAGFNGKLAWGMTMVLGDNQDLYLEQLRRQGNRLYYLADGKWQPTRERQETFFIKGQRPIREVIHETRHGPLLNSALGERKNILQPLPLKSGYGLAYRSIQQEADKTLDGFFDLSRAKTIEQAFDATREIRAMPLNIVFADEKHIGWQVTGRYPNRKEGRGLLPSWLGRPLRLGWLCRPDPPPVRPGPAAGLAGYRQPPHRAARLRRPVVQLLVLPGARRAHRPARRCQQEPRHPEHDPHAVRPDLAVRRQVASHVRQSRHGAAAAPGHRRLAGGATQPGAGGLRPADGVRRQADSQLQRRRAVRRLPPRERQADIPRRARTGGRPCLESLRRDRQPLLLGASRPPARARRQSVLGRYPHSAEGGQAGNPRAQPRRRRGVLRTATGERAQGLAMGQAAHLRMAERQLENGPYLGAGERAGLGAIKGYLDRGPYPAGGDHTTLDVSAYGWGQDFDTWLIPAMRLIVDFGQSEPMIGVNSSGQSGNPASPHYADGIDAWLKGRYVSFPFQPQNLDRVYGNKRLTLTPAR